MGLRAIGILSPGDMGSAIGQLLHDNGLEVLTCLRGRRELTRRRAQEAGFRDVPSYDQLVSEVGLLLSVVPPAEAGAVAGRLVDSLRRTGARPVYTDCNAVSPQTVTRIADLVADVGGVFIDAGIIGPPPRAGSTPRFYCSGPDCSAFEALREYKLDIRALGPLVGQASAFKMVYAASTKGTTALWTELLVAARALGLDKALAHEFALSRSDLSRQIMAQIPSMPQRSRRWIGEMEEIAVTFKGLGLTPRMLEGAAEVFRFVGETSLADQTSGEPAPPLETILDILTEHLRNSETPRPD